MIKYYPELIQGSEDWHAARCGLLTASEMDRVITIKRIIANEEHKNNPNKRVEKKKTPKNEEEKKDTHLYELLAQRVTKYVEPAYIGDDMLRGMEDEIDAKVLYDKHYARVQDMGFVTNDEWGFTLGYSPDGLVGDDGLIECKGRRQKFQIETIIAGTMPDDFKLQVQTGLLVTKRIWCDFISYCGGMHMVTIRILPDKVVQDAILAAATTFHEKLDKMLDSYMAQIGNASMRLIPTERRIEQEMTLSCLSA